MSTLETSTSNRRKTKEYDLHFKIIIIGDSGVGKSCILDRYTEDRFEFSKVQTIGTDFKFVQIPIDNQIVRLQLWDTSGTERFNAVTDNFLRAGHAVILVYDVTDRKSFESIPNWIQRVKKANRETVPLILLGNKTDLTNIKKNYIHADSTGEKRELSKAKKQVSYDEAADLAKDYGFGFVETSALENKNIDQAVEMLLIYMMNNLDKVQPVITKSLSFKENSSNESVGFGERRGFKLESKKSSKTSKKSKSYFEGDKSKSKSNSGCCIIQ